MTNERKWYIIEFKYPIYLVVGTGLPWAAQNIAVSCPSCLPIVRLKSSVFKAGDFALTGSESVDQNWFNSLENIIRRSQTWKKRQVECQNAASTPIKQRFIICCYTEVRICIPCNRCRTPLGIAGQCKVVIFASKKGTQRIVSGEHRCFESNRFYEFSVEELIWYNIG